MTEQQQKVWACAARGMTQAETARYLGLTTGYVAKLGKKFGLCFAAAARGRAAREDEIVACARRGLTQAEAARELGISSATVCKVKARLGLSFAYKGRGRRSWSGKTALARPDPAPAPAPKVAGAPARPVQAGKLSQVFHPRWSPADDLLLLRGRAAGDWFAVIAADMDRGVAEVQQRWHRLRAVPDIEALIEAHVEAGADPDAPWPDPSEVAA